MTRIGLDVGGTFTDVVALDERTGATSWFKVPTNVESPSTGVLDAIAATAVALRGHRGGAARHDARRQRAAHRHRLADRA